MDEWLITSSKSLPSIFKPSWISRGDRYLSHSSREHQVPLSQRLRLISKIEQELLFCIIPLDDVEMDEAGKEGDDFVAREL